MTDSGLERFLEENGNVSTEDLLKDRPSDEAVERLGRGWKTEKPEKKEKGK